ncbi:hypothetical protein C6B38_09195 [Spiroplasma sp. ChiS]|uniref:hypothetical protein n=1 Tax=Spiroplasma sp. ChiS TaxID=2099885 RepID=UPI000CFA007F|nr:hypothetical protein [Spiroplasma sp. ChiS]PQP77943.1 hypothetical protein C6B38_09195 [Spiroplasma sp. ChiS]
MTKEEFNTKYKDKFRINDYCDLEQWIECDCDHCQECKYSKSKQWSIVINYRGWIWNDMWLCKIYQK